MDADAVVESMEGLVETYPNLTYLDGVPEVSFVSTDRVDLTALKFRGCKWNFIDHDSRTHVLYVMFCDFNSADIAGLDQSRARVWSLLAELLV